MKQLQNGSGYEAVDQVYLAPQTGKLILGDDCFFISACQSKPIFR
ncbi:hypothetical protein [Methylophaga nitratireducenticrescens]|uniref:Uncharacterized protein n=1 Tax=Methylophaga nitratireducenticrescens TaxID=754476 RepID=I1XK94_METNJ|nr:hypothetical protein [Methylophaga nitratireducenticrescens]